MGNPISSTQPQGGSALSDTVLSLANHGFMIVAAYLIAKGWDNGTLEMLKGVLMAVVSFGFAFWQNSAGTKLDLIQSFVRRVLTLVLGFGASRGWFSNDVGAAVMNGFGVLFPLLASLVFNWKHPGPSLPGTTIVDGKPAPLKNV